MFSNFSGARSHLVPGGGKTLFFAHFESQLRGLFEVPTIPNSKFKMRNNFFSQRAATATATAAMVRLGKTANRNKKQVDQFNSILLETRRYATRMVVIARIRLPGINQPLNATGRRRLVLVAWRPRLHADD